MADYNPNRLPILLSQIMTLSYYYYLMAAFKMNVFEHFFLKLYSLSYRITVCYSYF